MCLMIYVKIMLCIRHLRRCVQCIAWFILVNASVAQAQFYIGGGASFTNDQHFGNVINIGYDAADRWNVEGVYAIWWYHTVDLYTWSFNVQRMMRLADGAYLAPLVGITMAHNLEQWHPMTGLALVFNTYHQLQLTASWQYVGGSSVLYHNVYNIGIRYFFN
jgi:hypothetical protein